MAGRKRARFIIPDQTIEEYIARTGNPIIKPGKARKPKLGWRFVFRKRNGKHKNPYVDAKLFLYGRFDRDEYELVMVNENRFELLLKRFVKK